MKRTITSIFAVMLALAMAMSLAACGGNNMIRLKKDNIENFLSISSTCFCNLTQNNGDLRKSGDTTFSGNADANIAIENKTGASFENVKLTLSLETEPQTWAGEPYCGWEFSSEEYFEMDELLASRGGGTTEKTKTVDVTLPEDGKWNESEKLCLKLYDTEWKAFAEPNKIKELKITVIDVSGTVVKNQNNKETS